MRENKKNVLLVDLKELPLKFFRQKENDTRRQLGTSEMKSSKNGLIFGQIQKPIFLF